ncbi:MAG: hypothetical protein ACLUKN_11905 [Bacilli bacterium]
MQKRFPCLEHAYGALRAGGTATTTFNASNEVAVAEFIAGRLPDKIADVVGKPLKNRNFSIRKLSTTSCRLIPMRAQWRLRLPRKWNS